MSKPHSYRDAGVDIDLESEGISALVRNLTYRRKGLYTMRGEVGHFAGLIDFGSLSLAMTVDGVGTKMLVADHMKDWTTVGIDCIAMNVNDLYVMNIEPVAFVDYIAADRLSVEKMAQIGVGLNEGARQANIDIVGGETATLAGLVQGLDLAGTCIGVQKKERVITGNEVEPGDCIIGFPSSGIHSNGLTLARKIVDEAAAWDEQLSTGRTLGEELLVPTRIYHEILSLCEQVPVHGMCHITGGGLLNFRRLCRYGFHIHDPIPPPEVFRWIQERGRVSDEEMYRTFNMGMGYAVITSPDHAPDIMKKVQGSHIVGDITSEPGVLLMEKRLA